jgi:replicative DNA helicase
VLVVDYLQRFARMIKAMGGKSADLREVVGTLTARLRGLACQLDCCVIAIGSQNRAGYSRSEQGAIATAKDSGEVEYDCDVLMALAEDKDVKRIAPVGQVAVTLYVDKNRQGQRNNSVALNFWPDRQQFTQAER